MSTRRSRGGSSSGRGAKGGKSSGGKIPGRSRSSARRTRTGAQVSAKISRAREIAASELVPFLGGGIDPDEHLYRSTSEGPRDLPGYTHERQIELAWGLHLTDPLAKRIIEITKDYTVADGLSYEIAPSEAEQERERRERAMTARIDAEKKAAQQEAALAALQGQAATAQRVERANEAAPAFDEDEGEDEGEGEGLDQPSAGDPLDPLDPEAVPDDGEPTTEEIREVLERHWHDCDNNWEIKQDKRAIGLGLWGEQIYPVFVTPGTGHVRLGWLDPRLVKAIQTDPENAERVVAVVVHGHTGGEDRVYRVVHLQEPGDVEAIDGADGFLVGAAPGASSGPLAPGDSGERKPYAGTCFYFAVNDVQGAKRGHSDLLHLIDWIDAYGSLLFDGLDAASLKGSFIWDVTLEGATEADIDAFRKRYARPPKKGAVRVHNERVKWEAVSPDMQASQHAELARLYRVHILGGAGLPEHWYGEGDSATRATASEMSAPVLRRLKARQKYFCAMVEQILRFQVDQAILAGALRGTPSTKMRVKVVAPEFEANDVAAGATALSQGTSALVVAEDKGWITKDTARKGFAAIARHLGVDVDPEQERAALETQGAAEGEAGGPDAEMLEEARRAAGDAGVVPPRGAGAGADSGGARAGDARAAEGWLETSDVGVFVTLPPEVAERFPAKAEDSSPPHVTLLYVGDLTRADLDRVRVAAASVARWTAPFTVEMFDYGEFANPAGETIAHMVPRSKGNDLEELHKSLRMSVEGAGVQVRHHAGPFKPHATLAYVPAGQAYAGPRPAGSWRVEALELWAFGERILLPLLGKAPTSLASG